MSDEEIVPGVKRALAAQLRPAVDRAWQRWTVARDEATRLHSYAVRMEIALELAERREAEDDE